MASQRTNTSRSLPSPSEQAVLQSILGLTGDIYLDLDEEEVVRRFLRSLSNLFPERSLAVRVFDPRTSEAARVFAIGGELRSSAASERIFLKQSSIEKTRLKTALAESARLRIGDRWDSPFVGVPMGFAVPLVASGELYGVLDVGYPLGSRGAGDDDSLILPIANYLSVALRNDRLHRETTNLRDYQANLIEYAKALIVGIDRHWRVRVCNREFCKFIGFEKRELLGSDLRDLLPRSVRSPYMSRLSDAFSLGGIADESRSTFEGSLLRKDGEQVRAVWSLATVMGSKDTEAVVAIGQDQTKIHDLQLQVIQAEKLATLGQLAAGVVHELNNPLTSISVYADVLLSSAKRDEETRADDIVKLERIRDGAERIRRFAKELVQYARPAGDDKLVVDLNDLVRRAISFCEHLFAGSDIELSVSLSAEPLEVRAVAAKLEQVIINLVTNAVHACEASGQVTIRTEVVDGGATVRVGDSGPGIPLEEREKVFEPFFTTKSGGGGTGLGLSIVKNILDEHEGEIAISTSPGGGADITFSLSLVKPGS